MSEQEEKQTKKTPAVAEDEKSGEDKTAEEKIIEGAEKAMPIFELLMVLGVVIVFFIGMFLYKMSVDDGDKSAEEKLSPTPTPSQVENVGTPTFTPKQNTIPPETEPTPNNTDDELQTINPDSSDTVLNSVTRDYNTLQDDLDKLDEEDEDLASPDVDFSTDEL